MMEYKGFIGRVEIDDDAGILHGEVINTRDVITVEGTSITELRQALVDSVEDYLAFCAERGEEPDKPYSGGFSLRVDPEPVSYTHLDVYKRQALRLSRFFGMSERFWINLQSHYDLELEKDRLRERLEREVKIYTAA